MPDRRRERGGTASLTLDSRPRLSENVSFEAIGTSGQWLVSVSDVPVSRVSAPVVALLSDMDGDRPLRDLRSRHGAAHDESDFLRLAERFRAAGLLAGAERAPAGRIVYRPPLTLQFATLRAPAIFARLDAFVRPLRGRGAASAVGAVTAAGLIALAAQIPAAVAALTSPMPLPALIAVVVTLFAATFAHEAAHGVALVARGGVPRRAGFMIFYLSPAFFVDVTDGWRLPGRGGRVAVALAGPALHLVVAAIAALGALAAGEGGAKTALLAISVSCLVVVAVNLLPFVRFDGYIALMSALDEPDLRARALADARATVARLLFGGPRAPRRLDRAWSVPFGIASAVAPVVLVGVALLRIADGLAAGGAAAGLTTLALTLLVATVVVVATARGVVRVWRSGVSRVRMIGVAAAVVAAVGAGGCVVTVPTTVTIGFVAEPGVARLVASATAPPVDLPSGAAVELTSNGLLGRVARAHGSLEPLPREAGQAPVSALAPVEVAGVTVPVVTVGTVATGTAAIPATGSARVSLGNAPAWQALWDALVRRPVAEVVGGTGTVIG